MKLNFKWKTETGQYQTGELLYINRIHCGGYCWNSMRNREDKSALNYVGNLTLPSLVDTSARLYDSNIVNLKFRMEKIVTNWFNEALLEENTNESTK